MSVLSWLQGLESRVFELAGRAATDERVGLCEDVEHTADELHQRHTAVTTCRASLREACARLIEIEGRVFALEEGVRTATREHDPAAALRQAVELEEARAALAAARLRVEQLRQACVNHQEELTRLESHLAGLQARLSPC